MCKVVFLPSTQPLSVKSGQFRDKKFNDDDDLHKNLVISSVSNSELGVPTVLNSDGKQMSSFRVKSRPLNSVSPRPQNRFSHFLWDDIL